MSDDMKELKFLKMIASLALLTFGRKYTPAAVESERPYTPQEAVNAVHEVVVSVDPGGEIK